MSGKEVLIGGEESGGIGIPRHLPERDGILNSLLIANAMADYSAGCDSAGSDYGDSINNLSRGRSRKIISKPEDLMPSFSEGTQIAQGHSLGTSCERVLRISPIEHQKAHSGKVRTLCVEASQNTTSKGRS
jgi:hypothetical protein